MRGTEPRYHVSNVELAFTKKLKFRVALAGPHGKYMRSWETHPVAEKAIGVVLLGVGLVPGLIAYEKDSWRLCDWGKKGSDKK